MCNENNGFLRLILYQQILNISSYTVIWLIKIQINHYYFTKVLYELVVVFNIIKWVLWSLSQRIPSKSSQTNPLLPERSAYSATSREKLQRRKLMVATIWNVRNVCFVERRSFFFYFIWLLWLTGVVMRP